MRRLVAALAAVVALGAAPAGAGGAPPRDAAAVRARRTTVWQRAHARLAKAFPAGAHSDAAELLNDWAELTDAGDLDGDGKNELVDVRTRLEYDDTLGFRETVRLEAFRGSDGKALWNRALPAAAIVFPIFTTVGVDGKRGVVVVSYEIVEDGTDNAGGGYGAVTVASFDGAGTPLWVRELGGSYGYAPLTYAAGATDVEAEIDAVAGGGKDLLLRTVLFTDAGSPADRRTTAQQFSILDGATGVVRPVGQPTQTEFAGSVLAAGDLDGDQLDDIVTEVGSGGSVGLVALSSTVAGKELWRLAQFATTDAETYLVRLPDVTGDGRADVGAETLVFGGGIIVIGPGRKPSGPTQPSSTMTLIDGARGTVAWAKKGSRLMVLGNADRKAGAEVAIGTGVYGSGKAGFTVAAYTATGRRLWSVTRTVKGVDDVDSSGFGEIGDVGTDGVADIGFGIVAGAGKRVRRDEGTIDGRTGRVTKDPRPGMYITRAALDGRGNDAYERVASRGLFTLHTWRGDQPVRLWSVTVRASGLVSRSTPTSVDGDKCGDVVFTISDAGFRSIVYSGSTGRPLWQLDRSGNAAGTVGAPSIVSHRTYRRGC